MTEVTLRHALRSDAADLAILDNLAGIGLTHWVWKTVGRIDRTEDAYAYGREQHLDDTSYSGWRNATVAVDGELVLGMSTCYINPENNMENLPELAELERLAPALAPILELRKAAAGHWYIDCLAVYPQARGRGIGTLLMDDFINRAPVSGAPAMSLIAENGNSRALQLYRSRGFDIAASRPFLEFEGSSQSTEWMLLTAQL